MSEGINNLKGIFANVNDDMLLRNCGNLYAENKQLQQENQQLKKKLDKAIELLIEYHMPCDIDDFNIKNSDYCSSNCSVDEEVFKKCWLRYIEQELEK